MRVKKRWLYFLIICIIFLCFSIRAEVESNLETDVEVIYLTFDDGPSEYTEQLLDLLKAHHMKATFFMLGPEMERYPEVVKRIVEEGHAVGVHGISHEKDIFYKGIQGPVNEMNEANDILEEISGQRTSLARPPYGSSPYLTKKQAACLENAHYVVWDWNVDSRDWSYRNAQRTFTHTIHDVKMLNKQPKVILLHDIKGVVQTMTLFLDWMEKNHYTSSAITNDLPPVKLWRQPGT